MKNGDLFFSDRAITKTELEAIYDDFKKIESADGVPGSAQERYQSVAERDGQIIGFASGLTNHRWFFLSDMWVREDYRRQGLGSKLLIMLEEKIKAIGIEHIYTWTSGFINPHFYEKHGYSAFTVFENFFEVEGYHHIGYRKDFVLSASHDAGFWIAVDTLISKSEIIIDRPKGTKHPRYDFVYSLDYGYLKGTSSMDGGGIDIWRGSLQNSVCDAVICTIDLFKRDSEIKLLIGCTEEEKKTIMQFHNESEYMKGTMIRRAGHF